MQQPDLTSLMQLLRSPEGQRLVQYLKTNGGNAAQTAAAQASAGDLSSAKSTLAPLLEDPKFQALLRQLGGTP